MRTFLIALLLLIGCRRGAIDRDVPEPYRKYEVPRARLTSPAARLRGAALYRTYCVLCHGAAADGRGVRSHNMNPPPRDFTRREWAESATPLHTFYVIREGVHGTAMPRWTNLSDDEVWDLVAYVLSISQRGP